MANTHVVVYDKTTGFVHACVNLVTHGSWQNSGTWETDGYLDFGTSGKVVQGLTDETGAVDTSNVGAFSVDGPTYDETDHDGYGVLQVDNTTTPTDTETRTDGGKAVYPRDYSWP